MYRTAVIGGGAAGFFLSINLKELMPEMDVTLLERSQHVLAKVKVSGGGRCNCTNSFASVRDLSAVYPRGHRLLKRLFKVFDQHDAYRWFEAHGVPLVTQADECVFPAAQDSQAIIDCFLREVRRLGIAIRLGQQVDLTAVRQHYDFVAVATGGSPRAEGLEWLRSVGQETVAPVPSLFTFSIADEALRSLMGTVAETASVMLPGTKLRAEGPLLITHWGMSGPAILRLSSYGARLLAEQGYRHPLSVNWTGTTDAEVSTCLQQLLSASRQRQVASDHPFGLSQRLWNYLLQKALPQKQHCRWSELSKKDINRLVNVLTNDLYEISGRAAFKDEFVTCGGVALSGVNPSTLESRVAPHLYFAGEVLDIDGVTGGFNFQAAWTTARVVAESITSAARLQSSQPHR